MAALLKKRALAEYSQVIQEEPKPPVKRLKLVHKPRLSEYSFDARGCSNPHEVLGVLLTLSENLPLPVDSAQKTSGQLIELFYKEESVIKVKVVSLLGELCKTPGFNPNSLITEFITFLKTEKSHKVIAEILNSLKQIGKILSHDKKLHQKLISLTSQHLKDSSHLVRCRCLEIIGTLGSPKLNDESTATPPGGGRGGECLQMTLSDYSHDRDSRVRTSALQALRGIKLERKLYEELAPALNDDYKGVRLAVTRLIWVMSHLYPESLIELEDKGESIRLVDDGFGKICNMINDLEMEVRAESTRLLGSMHLVSARFLHQTLDKKLMSNMRRKMSSHERQKEHYTRGEWATGQKWADDKPLEEVNEESMSLINSGACGAFVHGLEDEFLEVRNAAIDSVCELATNSEQFSRLCQDNLVDMFNDEIEAVRLNAINSLRKISHYLTLREDQLDIILSGLKDFTFDIRAGLHELFGHAKLETKDSLNSCVMALLDNMKRYPQDRLSIWTCMKLLGEHHPDLTLPLVPDLLSTHPFFDTPEPDMDDPAYISVLLLVFNAAVGNSRTISALFPEHTFRHYKYLRSSMPQLVPQLKLAGISPGMQLNEINNKNHLDISAFLKQTLDRLDELEKMDSWSAQQLLEVTMRDLKRIEDLEPSLSATAECESLYLNSQLLLMKALSGTNWSAPACIQTRSDTASMQKIIDLCREANTLYMGLTMSEGATVRQMKLKAMTIQLLHSLRINNDRQAILQQCKTYLDTLHSLQKYLSDNGIVAENFTQSLFTALPDLETLRLSAFTNPLQAAMYQSKPPVVKISHRLRKLRATIVEPTENSDNPLRFTAGLTVDVNMEVVLENVRDIENIKIQVEYADTQTHIISPPISDFRRLSTYKYRLLTVVTISHSLWSEPGSVKLSLVTEPTTDLTSADDKHRYISLCKPVSVLIATKPAKR
ncbi:integrator complex subunit 4-like isoform X2 [Tubulanus polymorphus]|uniref:integrator complex subunit 4-like isoform X2 n=1 Tax=Tubulanus polymorphus TaxID=672921 RepID=UPI003DA4203F